MRPSHLLRQLIDAFVAVFYGLTPREDPGWGRLGTLFSFAETARHMCPRLYRMMAQNGQTGAHPRDNSSSESKDGAQEEEKQGEPDDDDDDDNADGRSRSLKKTKQLGTLHVGGVEIPTEYYRFAEWSCLGTMDVKVPITATLIQHDMTKPVEYYCNEALAAQRTGAMALVIRTNQLDLGSDGKRVCASMPAVAVSGLPSFFFLLRACLIF